MFTRVAYKLFTLDDWFEMNIYVVVWAVSASFVFRWQTDGKEMAWGGLTFPDLGCLVPDIGIIYLVWTY